MRPSRLFLVGLTSALMFFTVERSFGVLIESDNPVALLESHVVATESQLSDYEAIQVCYGGGSPSSRRAAFMVFLEAAIAAESMRRHGGAVPNAIDLANEEKRIDNETRSPEILACIKDHFGRSDERYRNVFVRLRLTESRFRVFLINSERVQERPRRQIQETISLIHRGIAFETATREKGLSYSSATCSAADSFSVGAAYKAECARANSAGLAAGQLKTDPIESDSDIELLRLLKAEGGSWSFECATVRKVTAAEWFSSLKKMRLFIRDAELRRWIESLRNNPRLAAVILVDK